MASTAEATRPSRKSISTVELFDSVHKRDIFLWKSPLRSALALLVIDVTFLSYIVGFSPIGNLVKIGLGLICLGSVMKMLGAQLDFLQAAEFVPKTSIVPIAESITKTLQSFQSFMVSTILWEDSFDTTVVLGALYVIPLTSYCVSMTNFFFLIANLLFIVPVALEKTNAMESHVKPLMEKAHKLKGDLILKIPKYQHPDSKDDN